MLVTNTLIVNFQCVISYSITYCDFGQSNRENPNKFFRLSKIMCKFFSLNLFTLTKKKVKSKIYLT